MGIFDVKHNKIVRWFYDHFNIETGEGLDLFQFFPGIKKFFKERRLHAAIRTFGDVVFTIIILMGLFGPQEPNRNAMLYLSWGIWWPSVVLSWFFLGRMWCGILQKKGWSLNLKVPNVLKKNGVYWSVILLALIIWLEE